VKRRKKSTAAPNPKKMFEEAQMVRRVKAYLNNLKVITDEEQLQRLSLDCEPPVSAPNSAAPRKRHPSPTLSTTSTTSSTSATRFGAASPQASVKTSFLPKLCTYFDEHADFNSKFVLKISFYFWLSINCLIFLNTFTYLKEYFCF